MKWFATQKWLVLCLGFFLFIGMGSLPLVQAQPMEEEEEELQPRPNPMDKTNMKGRGSLSMQPGQSLQNKRGISGKGLTAGGTGIAIPGSSAASGTGQLPKGNPLEDMRNPMSGQSAVGMGTGGSGTPDNPIDPVTIGINK